ncbi:MAG TPA: ABC transporter permease [Micropepsaceae bacterium]|nr:ABC transporter permease [Micropepsaceae bacterium]
MTVLVLTMAAPLGLLLAYSLWRQDGLFIDTRLTLAEYAALVSDPGFAVVFLRSLAIAAVASIAAILLAYPVAWFIAFRARAKFLWLLLVTIPFWTSYLLRVFAWKVILGYNGLINSGLMALHLVSAPVTFLLYNPVAVVLTLIHGYAPFAVLPIYVALEKIDPALLEAAADLGDSPARRFLRVTLPLSMSGVIAAFVLMFVPATGDYVTPSLVGGANGLMVANLIQAQFGRADNWPLGAAMAITTIAAVSLLSVFAAAGARCAAGRIR